MRTSPVLILGAVAYDAKVVPIWDGFKAWFEARGLPFDYVLYTNYEHQVDAHMRGDVLQVPCSGALELRFFSSRSSLSPTIPRRASATPEA